MPNNLTITYARTRVLPYARTQVLSYAHAQVLPYAHGFYNLTTTGPTLFSITYTQILPHNRRDEVMYFIKMCKKSLFYLYDSRVALYT